MVRIPYAPFQGYERAAAAHERSLGGEVRALLRWYLGDSFANLRLPEPMLFSPRTTAGFQPTLLVRR